MEILVIVFLTFLNGIFSLSEIAMISLKPSRVQTLVDQGNPRARTVMLLLSDPERFLSSIQVGITLIGIVSGVYGGATLASKVQSWLLNWGLPAAPAQTLALLAVIGSITYFTIVMGELVPKSLALNNPEKIALGSANFVWAFTRLTYPLVKILSLSTQAVLRLLRVKERRSDTISAEELRSIIRTANMQGVLNQDESQAHHNLLRFSEQSAGQLMTRRSQVEWIDCNKSTADILEQVKSSVRSKYPVARGSLDHVIGTLGVRDFLEQAGSPDFELNQVIRPPIVIPEIVPAFSILQLFKKNKQYIALVVDEHGQFEGLVTLHDLTEAIMGDLPDEDEEEDHSEEIIQRQDGSWLVGGRVQICDLNARLERQLIEEDSLRYSTVAGFFLTKLECIPQPGSLIAAECFDGEVLDMDGHRIDKVLITLKEQTGR